jgi:hypothetical protein
VKGAHDHLKWLLTLARNRCSRSSEIRAHDHLKWLLTLARNRCSRSSEIRAHDAVKSVLTIPRNTQPERRAMKASQSSATQKAFILKEG